MKNKKMKNALVLGGCCILAGVILTAVGTGVLGGTPGFYIDKTGFHNAEDAREHRIQTMKKTKIDAFENLSVDIEYADIEVIPSDDYYLEYQLDGSEKPDYSIKNGTFTFQDGKGGSSSIFNFSFYGFDEESVENVVKVYIPKDIQLKKVNLSTSSGEIDIKDSLKIDTLIVDDEYGDLSMDTVDAKSVEIDLASGDVKIADITADSFSLTNEYGEAVIQKYNCKSGTIDMDSGDVELRKADFHALSVENEYGSVSVETVRDIDDYEMNLSTEYGVIEGADANCSDDGEEQTYKTNGGTLGKFEVKCESGDILIKK